jgi:aa3 type cytochrome c oxidase subunit IV
MSIHLFYENGSETHKGCNFLTNVLPAFAVNVAIFSNHFASLQKLNFEDSRRLHMNAASPDVAEHERTFNIFVKAMMIFAAHVMVILLLLSLLT